MRTIWIIGLLIVALSAGTAFAQETPPETPPEAPAVEDLGAGDADAPEGTDQADEPTTALDVTIQAQILDLLRSLQAKHEMSILLITHDLGVVAEMADEVCVMYASKIVERAQVDELFANPLHPYTQGLFRSMPRLSEKKDRLDVIPGNVPNPLHFPSGCKFHPRCELGCQDAACRAQDPKLREVKPGHWAACLKVQEVA